MVGLSLILAHLVGDYVVQNDWMASNKSNPYPGFKTWGPEAEGRWCIMSDSRICRVCHGPVSGLMPVCASCPPLMERYRHMRDRQDSAWMRDETPVETRRDRRAAKASTRTVRRPTA